MAVHKIRLRMYNVGFGDSFLLSVDHDDGTWRMLVDCGVHTGGGSEHTMSTIVDQIIADLAAESGGSPALDVVAASHRHRDHVSGFERAEWDTVRVGEVWMPFTENPDDELGRAVLLQQSRKAQKLHQHLGLLGAAGNRDAQQAQAVVENSLTNAAAMDRLHNRFDGVPRRRFFPNPNVEPVSFRPPALPDTTVYMLGPKRDMSVIAVMDPPADERWLRGIDAHLNDEASDPSSERLFAEDYEVNDEDVQSSYRALYLDLPKREALKERAVFDAWAAASSISDAVNNTSLVFTLDIAGVKLLFPGDAQWGLWSAILDDPAIVPILTDTRIYKVGHHGSHNATHTRYAKQFMGDSTTSMMSFHTVDDWPSIPDLHLVEALAKGPRTLVRSDVKSQRKGLRWHDTISVEYCIELN